VPKGLVVLSYDLVSDGEWVVDADVCARVPLPGSDGPEGDGSEKGKGGVNAQVVDVVVCALSLMSTNWVGTVREAWRILKLKYVVLSSITTQYNNFATGIFSRRGELKIAEVSSRFTDMEAFVSLVSAVGFKLRSKVRQKLSL
jgi:ribosomal RNA-processing protein 8